MKENKKQRKQGVSQARSKSELLKEKGNETVLKDGFRYDYNDPSEF